MGRIRERVEEEEQKEEKMEKKNCIGNKWDILIPLAFFFEKNGI